MPEIYLSVEVLTEVLVDQLLLLLESFLLPSHGSRDTVLAEIPRPTGSG
jgi:hypothetical protein